MIDDEQVVERLRRAHAAESAPQVDATRVLRAGRRSRRRRRVTRWSGVAAASVLTLGVGAGLAGGWSPFRETTVETVSQEVPEFVAATVLDAYYGVPAGAPSSYEEGDRAGDEALIDLETRTVTLWTDGSGSCPTLPKAIRAQGDTIEIVVGTPDGVVACTADSVTSTYVVALPSGSVADEDTTVDFIFQLSAEDADDLPTVMPPRDASTCLPALTVCAMNRWLDDMLTAAGLQPPDYVSTSLRAGTSVQVEGAEIWWRLFPHDRAVERTPLAVHRTTDVGAVVVEHGTISDNREAQFTCGGFRIEASPGHAMTADLLAETVDTVAATIDTCPANLDELLTRYPDLSPR